MKGEWESISGVGQSYGLKEDPFARVDYAISGWAPLPGRISKGAQSEA